MSQHHGRIAFLVAGLALTGVLGAGCSAISKVRQTYDNVKNNKATVDAFTQNLDNGKSVPFAATYATTGSAPATVVYAVDPSSGGLAFHLTQTGGSASNAEFIVNASGNYSCTQGGLSWSCTKLDKASAADQENLFNFYTPSHWVNFLKGVSLVAGLAGDKVSTSSISLNGFNMSCVDLVAHGVPGTSTICTTPQNILGYVKVAQESTSFEITNYSGSPSPSLFQLPPGATVTTPPTPPTPTTPTTPTSPIT
jgi:outer membrane murein-binding lipoprotein Lpp